MSETTGKQKKTERAKEAGSVKVETGALELGELEGFTPEEVARLTEARHKIASGVYTDITPEHRKLLFVQWLIDNEKLKS